jgi:hypothetical protein
MARKTALLYLCRRLRVSVYSEEQRQQIDASTVRQLTAKERIMQAGRQAEDVSEPVEVQERTPQQAIEDAIQDVMGKQ